MSYEDSHRMLLQLLDVAVKRRQKQNVYRGRDRLTSLDVLDQVGVLLIDGDEGNTLGIDPPGCMCPTCANGASRPAKDDAEFELARACRQTRREHWLKT